MLGASSANCPPSHKPQCAPCNQRPGVFNMCEGCDAACSRDLVMAAATLNRLRRNDRAMIRWICNVKAKDEDSSDSLHPGPGYGDPH